MQEFQDVQGVLAETDKIYARLVALGKPDKVTLTKQKIYEQRGWEPSRPLIEANFDAELARLGVAYIPRVLQPGPCFIFPLYDASGQVMRAQTRPMPGSKLYSEKTKYFMLGDKLMFLGPTWIGADPQEVAKILATRAVTLVEGGFDLLATRLLGAVKNSGILTPLTKRVGKKHIVWLKVMGVQRINLLYDHEKSKQGDEAMRQALEDLKDFDVRRIEMFGGAEDPSQALKNQRQAVALYRVLEDL